MRHPHFQFLLTPLAAFAIGLSPVWVPLASADDAAGAAGAAAGPSSETTADPTAPAIVPVTVTPPSSTASPTDSATPASEPSPSPKSDQPTTTADDTTPSPVAVVDQPRAGDEAGDGGDEGDGGTLPDGVVVTVDGRDIKATDAAGSLPKIAGCSFDITVNGLGTDPADSVGVKVIAWPPSVPEDGRVALVDVTETSSGGTWAGSYPLDEAVQQFTRMANGYHMRLEVYVNGVKGAMKMYWLGCGAPQTGDPRRMTFDALWTTADGTPVTRSLDSVLPVGWRRDFAIHASSERGTADCTYPAQSDVLTCVYDNPGHADQPGIVLPGEPGTEYAVEISGVPKGWNVDPTSIGLFMADDVCPKGDGDDHGDDPADETAREGDTKEPCLHQVVVTAKTSPVPPDDQGGGGANPPSDPTGTQPDASPNVSPVGATLPATGATTLPLVPLGLGLLVLGAALLAVNRRATSRGRVR